MLHKIFKKNGPNTEIVARMLNIFFAESLVHDHVIPLHRFVYEYFYIQYMYVVTKPLLDVNPGDLFTVFLALTALKKAPDFNSGQLISFSGLITY